MLPNAEPMLEVMVPATVCTLTTVCMGSAAPFSSTACSMLSSYETDVASAFGAAPYVIVESYIAAKSCAGSKLANVTVYRADGRCHKISASTSYIAIRAADKSVTISTYVSATCTGMAVTTLDVSSAQAFSQSCAAGKDGILDKKSLWQWCDE
ncbi:hypothetical protein GN244_ATG16740 [Phytophthora infestans]|uniref:Uncharacterized protein n=1 Tax=Phytophthora infestans TaxID=4787 RepID=A0A833W753_PHYIN|nr:hypothetical protein GN244_ATG16740 [Phytophthora infestans]KAF4148350.1 hypothetical protein GN958_ATG02482 [Phytophthora infestans]